MKTLLQRLLPLGLAAGLIAVGSAFAASPAENYENQCAKCHGADGKGQTKVGKRLNLRDMTTEAYKKELDDAKALASLKEGIKKDGKEIKKSYASEFSDADLKGLIAYVRTLK